PVDAGLYDLVADRNVVFAVGNSGTYARIVDGSVEYKPPTPKITTYAVELADAGKLMLFGRAGGVAAAARLDADSGTLDPRFGEGGITFLRGPGSDGWNGTFDPSGNIFVAGEVETDDSGATSFGRLSRVTPAGVVDETFGDAGHVTFAFP